MTLRGENDETLEVCIANDEGLCVFPLLRCPRLYILPALWFADLVHPQNVQLHNVQLQNVQLPNVQLQNVQDTKRPVTKHPVTERPGYTTSRTQNVQF
jgi:hypothetical protein